MHEYYSVDEILFKHPNFKNIERTLDNLCRTDAVEGLPMNCISACDILQNMLSFYDIDSKIIECQLMAVKENSEMKEFCFVGFDEVVHDEGIDTHVVIITQTEPPILIDASIGHLLPKEHQIVAKVLVDLDPEIIGKFSVNDVSLTYHPKKNIRLPGIHQKNLIDRIKNENAIDKKIKLGTKVIVAIAFFTIINFLANFSLLGFELFKIYMK